MIDEELALQQRDVTGERVQVCERCGRPLIGNPSLPVAPRSPLADPTDGIGVCASCWLAVETGMDPIPMDDEDNLA